MKSEPLAGGLLRVVSQRRFRLPAPWLVLLAASPILAVTYLLLPVSGPARPIAYPLFGLIATLTITIAVRRRSPARPRAWALIALAFTLLSAGDVTYTVLALTQTEIPYPSFADLFYLGGYGALIAGVAGLLRGRLPGSDRTSIVDAAVLAAGVASLFWVTIVQPSIAGTIDPIAATVSMAYPGVDVIVLALMLRVILSSASRPRYLQLLVGGLGLYFIADVVYAIAVLDGTYVDGHPVDAGWIVGVLVIAAAALHPTVAQPVVTVATGDIRLGRTRLLILGLAAMVAPVIMLFEELKSGNSVQVGLIVQWTVLFGLVFVRLAATVGELGVSLSQRRRLQADLAYQANHDPLTRLANRLLFEVRLGRAMETAPGSTALIFLDIDDFKAINDTLGHATGDEVLRVLAGRLQRTLRAADLAARIGGDEFAILVENCPDPTIATGLAERAIAAMRAPVALGGRQLLVRASAGVAIGADGATALDLMRDADVAMYQAKAHGKDHVEAFQSKMHEEVVRGYQLRTELATAVEANQFVLHYQPIIDLTSGAIVGAEALVRWRHPERGIVGPAEFMPQAESSGLIVPLGRWILREACSTAARWPIRADGRRTSISVNLAASQLLEPGLVDDVARTLAETGLAARWLTLEVTESALVDLAPARDALRRLRDLGVQLALDDFGTGYSALSYLAELPFDVVKIDQSFVANIGQGERVDSLLAGIIGLCDALELTTVAEGIEHSAQLRRLTAMGCRIGQGYLFARPVPSVELDVLLAEPREPVRLVARGGAGSMPGAGVHHGVSAAI
jgi:diguanylate cyclase